MACTGAGYSPSSSPQATPRHLLASATIAGSIFASGAALALLLSGAALLVALRQGGHGGAQPAALAAAAAAREKHVDSPAPEGEIHIPGLAIYQGQIVDAAVGSRELEDGAVTVRERDSMAQTRVAIDDLEAHLAQGLVGA